VHKAVAAVLAGTAAGMIAYAIQYFFDASTSTILALCLPINGVFQTLILEGRRAVQQRELLREGLDAFLENARQRSVVNPLWQNLCQQISAVLDSNPNADLRQALRDGLADITRLAHHTSFLALEERDIRAIRRLRELMER
jgi:hypothetical protein